MVAVAQTERSGIGKWSVFMTPHPDCVGESLLRGLLLTRPGPARCWEPDPLLDRASSTALHNRATPAAERLSSEQKV